MKHPEMLPFRRSVVLGIALFSATSWAQSSGLYQTYCSTENTGSDYNAVTNIWQSNGACHDTCNADNYAFAIVQYQQCWCSNYIPAGQASVSSDCNQNCPGYPDEKCGDSDSGYYGYIALGPEPSGTAGAAAAVSSSSAISTSTLSTLSTLSSPSSTSSTSSTSSPISPTTTTASTPSPTPTFSSTSTSTTTSRSTLAPATSEAAITSIVVQTVSGNVVTQTVTSTPLVAPNSRPDNIQIERKGGLGAGAVAGIVVGVVAGLAILALAAFLLWRRRRKNNGDPENHEGSLAGSKKSMTRNVSVLSKAGLLTRGRGPSMSERDQDDYVTPATGSNSVRHSMMFGAGAGVSPASPLDSSHSGGSRRLSQPMVYDQRLNPSALFANQEANGSRISMQDQQDYSRPLGVMNPDPRASFESRISHAP